MNSFTFKKRKEPENDDFDDLKKEENEENNQENNQFDHLLNSVGPRKIDLNFIKKCLSKLEKTLKKNELMRSKFINDPTKFIESETELDYEIKQFSCISSAPELYYLLADNDFGKLLISLLSHENTDISISCLDLLNGLLEGDSLGEEEDEEGGGDKEDENSKVAKESISLFISYLVEQLQILPILTDNINRLKESNDEEKEGIFTTLSILENIITFDKENCTKLMKTNFITFLIQRITIKEFDSVKLYCTELLSEIANYNVEIKQYLISNGAIEALLQLTSLYKRKDPKESDEIEMMENSFDILCFLLSIDEGKLKFLEEEGIELMLIMLR